METPIEPTGCLCHGLNRPDPLRSGCQCAACQAIRAEGYLDPHIGCHLLMQRWPGRTTGVEKAYRMAHAVWAQVGAQRLAGRRFTRLTTPFRRVEADQATPGHDEPQTRQNMVAPLATWACCAAVVTPDDAA